MLILRIQVCFFLTYRALKVAGNYRPERRKMGFDLRTFGAMLGGIYHKKCCLQSLLLLLASIGFVINSRLPLMRPSSLASIAFVMTGVLARLSISLSKHWELVPNCFIACCRSLSASIAFGHPNPECEGRSSPKTPPNFQQKRRKENERSKQQNTPYQSLSER